MRIALILFGLLLFLTQGGMAEPKAYDIAIMGGIVMTLDEDRTHYSDGYVLIHEGRILKVGRRQDFPKDVNVKKKIPSEGKYVLPGWNIAGMDMSTFLQRKLDPRVVRQHKPLAALRKTNRSVEVGARASCAHLLRHGVTGVVTFTTKGNLVGDVLAKCGIRALVGQEVSSENLVDPRNYLQRWKGNRTIKAYLQLEAKLSDKVLKEMAAISTQSQSMVGFSSKSLKPLDWERLKSLGLLHERTLLFGPPSPAGVYLDRGLRLSWQDPSRPFPSKALIGVSFLQLGGSFDPLEELRLYRRYRQGPSSNLIRQGVLGGATFAGWDRDLGVLEFGKKADVQIFDLEIDPWSSRLNELDVLAGQASVTHTIVDGEVVFEAGRLQRVNEEKLRKSIGEYEARLKAALARN